MRNQDSYSRDNRSRGDQRGRGQRGPRDGSNRNRSNYSKPTAPKRLTFWQKLLGIFGVKPTPSASSARPSRKPERTAPPRAARKPESVEVTSPKIYVGNLSFDATESDLQNLFNGVGQVQSAEIVIHRETQKSKGFGFVTMQSTDEARRAVSELHDKDFMGRNLVVSGAKTNDVRNSD